MTTSPPSWTDWLDLIYRRTDLIYACYVDDIIVASRTPAVLFELLSHLKRVDRLSSAAWRVR